jgi:hypothetical protein
MGVAKSIQKMCVFNAHSNATNCDCGHPYYIIDDCPIHAFKDGLMSLHEATPEAIQYLCDLNIEL